MARHISNIEAFSRITPWALRNYVAAQGWREVEPYGDVGYVYAQDEISDEIIIPSRQDFSDYALVVSRIILSLAETEERDELTIARDLSLAHFDRISIRVPGDYDDGSVSVDAGVTLFEKSRQMLLSAACSALRPQSSFSLGKNRDAIYYINNVRLGQTERGSFVINLLSRVPSESRSGSLRHRLDDPFERKVTRKLASGLQAVREATTFVSAAQIPEFYAFEKRIRDGVSANLCESVGELIGAGGGGELDISINWAITHPNHDGQVSVKFSREDAPVLEKAAETLRNPGKRPNALIKGFVSTLARNQSEYEGRVTIKAEIDKSRRAVRIDFSPADYARVVDAHSKRLKISVKGDLWRDGHRWVLSNPHDVEILYRYND